MCRRNQLAGGCLACLGVGMLIATFFESMLLCGCIGVLMVGGGILVISRK